MLTSYHRLFVRILQLESQHTHHAALMKARKRIPLQKRTLVHNHLHIKWPPPHIGVPPQRLTMLIERFWRSETMYYHGSTSSIKEPSCMSAEPGSNTYRQNIQPTHWCCLLDSDVGTQGSPYTAYCNNITLCYIEYRAVYFIVYASWLLILNASALRRLEYILNRYKCQPVIVHPTHWLLDIQHSAIFRWSQPLSKC